MSHESIVYGFIGGSGFVPAPMCEMMRKHNKRILTRLPEFDEFPYLTRGMFSCPRQGEDQGTFVTQVIHFGGSVNFLVFNEVPIWIEKFERLLARLYWIEATAHIWPDYIDGCYQYWWHCDGAIIDSYRSGKPSPTNLWQRRELRLVRHLDGPPQGPYPEEPIGTK